MPKEDSIDTGLPMSTNPLVFFRHVSRSHRLSMFSSIIAVLIAGVLSALFPYTFKLIVDAATGLARGGSYDALLFAAIVYIVISTSRELVYRFSGYTGSYWATGTRATARQVLSSYVTLHSRDFFANRFAGSLATKISHASSGMRDFIRLFLWEFLTFTSSFIASVVILFWVSPMLGALFIGWVIVVAPLNIYRAQRRVPYTKWTQETETKLTGMTVDLLTNIGAMQEYTRRTYEMERLNEAIEERRLSGLKNWHFGEVTLTANTLIQSIFAAVMIFVAIQLAASGALSAGDIVLVITLIYRIEDSFLFLGTHINEFTEVWGEVQESLEAIVAPHEIVDTQDAHALTIAHGALAFNNVSFTYGKGSNEVMNNFQLQIPGTQKVGLVGKSGAGKSTLVKLLLRHYEVNSGEIAIDGQNIREVAQDSLREAISVVPQEPLLFHRSLRENIAYGNPNATLQQIEDAAKLAQAHDFIMALPDAYETLVGERGVKLSGGERQRVAIARAILKNAPILILDEATASLDSESEVAIQQALHELMKGKTVIAIAHRLSTLREMDRILVLDKGKISEEGTHQELLQKSGVYSDLWKHQAGGFLQDE